MGERIRGGVSYRIFVLSAKRSLESWKCAQNIYTQLKQTQTHTNHSRGIIMKSLVPTHRITTFRPSVNFSATSVEPEQKARLVDARCVFVRLKRDGVVVSWTCLFVALLKEVETMVVKKENRKASLSFLVRLLLRPSLCRPWPAMVVVVVAVRRQARLFACGKIAHFHRVEQRRQRRHLHKANDVRIKWMQFILRIEVSVGQQLLYISLCLLLFLVCAVRCCFHWCWSCCCRCCRCCRPLFCLNCWHFITPIIDNFTQCFVHSLMERYN